MLMIFQPAGFDRLLARLARMSEAQLAGEKLIAALNEQ